MPTHGEVVPSFVCRSWEEQAFHLSQTDFRGVCFFVMREQENGMIGQNGVMSVYALQNLQAGPPGYTVTGPQILHCSSVSKGPSHTSQKRQDRPSQVRLIETDR